MIETLKKFKYLIIIVVVLVGAFIAYTIYTGGSSSTDTSTSMQKTASDGTVTTATGSGSAVPNNELAKSFVDQLLAIQTINLKVSFFADPVFTGLVDNHKGIDPQPIGRPNPFAPIGNDNGQSSGAYQDISGSVINSASSSSVIIPSDVTSSSKSGSAAITSGTTKTTKKKTTATTTKATVTAQ